MKRSVLLIALGLGAVVLAAVFLYPRQVATPRQAEPIEALEPETATEARRPSRRLVPAELPHEADRPDAAPAEPGRPFGGVSRIDEAEDPTALIGLDVQPMNDGLREKLKVPDDSQLGEGVVVQRVHPDSPAAEVFLEPNDVILRANKQKVDSPQGLEEVVGDREHTLITFSRDGTLLQVVLKKPYRAP